MRDVGDDLIGYHEWGARFFETAVTEERVLAGVNAMAGQRIDVDPIITLRPKYGMRMRLTSRSD